MSEKRVKKSEKGFTLLEVIIVVTIVMILGSVSFAMHLRNVVFENETETQAKLTKLTAGFVVYYDLSGSYATALTDLAPYTDAQAVTKDAWGKSIWYMTNIVIDGHNYPAAFVSGGKDGTIQSQISGNVLTINPTDLYSTVTTGMLEQTNRSISTDKVGRADAALNLYLSTETTPDTECQTPGSTVCIEVLYAQGLIQGTDAYDNWGQALVVDNAGTGFYSPGPDGTGGTSDDVV